MSGGGREVSAEVSRGDDGLLKSGGGDYVEDGHRKMQWRSVRGEEYAMFYFA